MSDFLVTFDGGRASSRLLESLRALYSPEEPDGWSWRFGWGEAALLRERIGGTRSCREQGAWMVGWVGDLPGGESLLAALLAEVAKSGSEGRMRSDLSAAARTFARIPALDHFDGSGAVLLAGPSGFALISDPMAGVQVYVARNAAGRVLAVGTHSDLVASACGKSNDIDPVSVGDFLDTGTPCCPYTMYEGILELEPGRVLAVDAEGNSASAAWWTPPQEDSKLRVEDAAEEYARLWRRAVEKRCAGRHIGIQLSGGMDSRVVMAAVPGDFECIGLTFCDELNREARISKQVAECYGREWVMLQRDPEYLAQTALAATRFTGCEGEWHHAHAIGLTREFLDRGFDDVFTGLFMDNNFKGYYAEDIVPVTRWRGLLPPGHEMRKMDYVRASSPFCRSVLRPAIQEARVTRRQRFYDQHFARGRQSEWEWLDGHPVSQASDNTGWFVERRVLPLRLPVYDRQLVDLALRIPAMLKVHDDFFGRALVRVLGPGNRIPNANDGACPGSSALGKHLQRLGRKTQRSLRSKLEILGWRSRVPHSWHDYKHYWRTSPLIRSLVRDHEKQLEAFDAAVPSNSLSDGLRDDRLPWRLTYRILQLALWREARPKVRPAAPAACDSSALCSLES